LPADKLEPNIALRGPALVVLTLLESVVPAA
jgi:hypothetical protein